VRTEELQSAITREERELLLRDLDLSQAEAFARSHSADQLEELGLVWHGLAVGDDDGLAVLRARPILHPTVVARFVAYGFAPRRSVSAGWFLAGYIDRRQSGEVVVRQLAIEPEHDQQMGVTTDVLRSFGPATIIAKVRAYLAALPGALALEAEWSGSAFDAAVAEESRAAAEAIPAPTRGPRGYDDSHYEEVARLCLDEYALRGRGVLDRVAKRRERPHETVRDWVREATRRGFLAPRERGQNVFEPGVRLRSTWSPPASEKEEE
jgi:hypothetical protein